MIQFSGLAPAQVVKVGTGGYLVPQEVAFWRDAFFRTAAPAQAATFVMDLTSAVPLASSLEELIVPLARRVATGHYGAAKLVVCTPDERLRNLIGGLAILHSIAFYVCASPAELQRAVPVGASQTEQESLTLLQSLGGMASASIFAAQASLQLSAASNRLVNLEKRGYVHRVKRGGGEGDLFVDPRTVPLPAWYAGSDVTHDLTFS